MRRPPMHLNHLPLHNHNVCGRLLSLLLHQLPWMILMCVQSGVHNHVYFSELYEHLNHRCCQMLESEPLVVSLCWLCPAQNVLCSSQKCRAACCKLQATGLNDGTTQRDVLILISSWITCAVLYCYLEQERHSLTHDCACAL